MVMAPTEITVNNRNECSYGNQDVVTATATSIANGNTFDTKLGVIYQVFFGNLPAGAAITYTASGGVLTFSVTGGTLSNVDLAVIGLS
jgi:hypothetical protein